MTLPVWPSNPDELPEIATVLDTRQLHPGSQRVFVPPCLVILWMLRTTLKSSPNCWTVDAATFCLDTMPRNSPFALSSSSATHCAVRTPETEVT